MRYARHLLPLVSIDLAAVDSEFSGWLHLVSPVEPYEQFLGSLTGAHWGPYVQENWIGFRLTDAGKYELLGDFRFFGMENTDQPEPHRGAWRDLENAYAERHASYAKEKAAYAPGQPKTNALTHLGGAAPATDYLVWNDLDDAAFTYKDGEDAPRRLDGRPYRFIAAVPGYSYYASGADYVLLYFDPVDRIALQTFVFS